MRRHAPEIPKTALLYVWQSIGHLAHSLQGCVRIKWNNEYIVSPECVLPEAHRKLLLPLLLIPPHTAIHLPGEMYLLEMAIFPPQCSQASCPGSSEKGRHLQKPPASPAHWLDDNWTRMTPFWPGCCDWYGEVWNAGSALNKHESNPRWCLREILSVG